MACHRNSSPERPSWFTDKLFLGVSRDSSHLLRKTAFCVFFIIVIRCIIGKNDCRPCLQKHLLSGASPPTWSRRTCHPTDGRLAVTLAWVSVSGSPSATLEPSCSPAFSLFSLLQAQNVPDRRCSWIQPWSGNKRMCTKATPNFKQDRGLLE